MKNIRHDAFSKIPVICLTLLYFAVRLTHASAEEVSVSTIPAGYFTLNVPAGTGTVSSLTALSFPLQGIATARGRMTGTVTALTSTTITNSNAGWMAGELSTAATPYMIQFTSGNATGRTFLLSTTTNNTSTTVTLDPTDSAQTPNLTAIASVGDAYQIIPADTISSLFGTPATTGINGGNGTATNADQVTIITATFVSYYYDTSTTPGHWLRASLPHTFGDNIVVRPDSGVTFSRFGTAPLALTVAGQVPSLSRKSVIAIGKPATYANSWPVDQTLGASNIQNIPGWASGSSASTADSVEFFNPSTGWHSYFYNGTHWILSDPSQAISDSLNIPAGTIGYISTRGTLGTYAILSQPVPYSL